MEKMNRFDIVTEYNIFNNHETLHPLVSVICKLRGSQVWEKHL